jgi:NAD(P)-dependent dehydrogenase (short-subunit alcohol dehydrogenase family)
MDARRGPCLASRIHSEDLHVKRLLVVGASGDVGQGIVPAAVAAGWRVVAAARNADRLEQLRDGASVNTVRGDLATEDAAAALWSEACQCWDGLDAVVVAVNAPNRPRPLMSQTAAELREVLDANLLTHFIAARTFIPRLPADGVFIGVGGGTADFIIPQLTQLSMVQAALRMMYRGMAREHREGPAIRELMIISMVNGASKRDRAELGRHVCAILAAPAQFPGPVLRLESREQVGRPDVAA